MFSGDLTNADLLISALAGPDQCSILRVKQFALHTQWTVYTRGMNYEAFHYCTYVGPHGGLAKAKPSLPLTAVGVEGELISLALSKVGVAMAANKVKSTSLPGGRWTITWLESEIVSVCVCVCCMWLCAILARSLTYVEPPCCVCFWAN